MTGPGLVSIVGAGPGDPGLLTLSAAKRLKEAELVLHDALVSPEVLALATRALRVSVGKRAGRPSTRQESIHRLMIRAARRGRRVVRLKGGDPFVFGRGGEEALALAEAGVPFEVVPGVSSALAAPASAGLPVTHRGIASSFVVVTGHAEAAYRSILSALPPGGATVVVLMGLANRGAIARLLLSGGWAPATPAAVCLSASRPESSTWIGRLDELAEGVEMLDAGDAPGTIVVGEVVSLAARIGGTASTCEDEPRKERLHVGR